MESDDKFQKLTQRYSPESFNQLLEAILENDSLEEDDFIEKLRNLPEYVVFGEKYNKSEYFDLIKENKIFDEILYTFRKDCMNTKVNV